MHPKEILFSGEKIFPNLSVVDHYAGNEKLILKALKLQAETATIFDITCDCEDGARAGAEAEHAQMCGELISSAANQFKRVGVRIHDITHAHWRDDLKILLRTAGKFLAYITLPKVRSLSDVVTHINDLAKIEANYNLNPIPLHVMIETHGALQDVWAIAAQPRVESLDFGIMDFVSAHYGALPSTAMKSPGQFQHPLIVRAKSIIVAAALGNGVVPTHNICTELKDDTLVFSDAHRARYEFGFLRMWSIHPQQIQQIVMAMRPDFAEVNDALAILIMAQNQDWGPIKYHGQLHDRASYRYYWQLLQQARATGVELPPEAQTKFFN